MLFLPSNKTFCTTRPQKRKWSSFSVSALISSYCLHAAYTGPECKGTLTDKLRVLLMYYVCKDHVSEEEIKELTKEWEHAQDPPAEAKGKPKITYCLAIGCNCLCMCEQQNSGFVGSGFSQDAPIHPDTGCTWLMHTTLLISRHRCQNREPRIERTRQSFRKSH